MPESQFNYRDAQGRAVASRTAPPGQVGYQSEAIDPATGRTGSGDVFNAFRGYVGPDGGTFGGSGVRGRAGFTGVSGVSADQMGIDPNATDEDYDAITRLFGGMANGDRASMDEALRSTNAFTRRTGAAYSAGRGSQGLTDTEFADFETRGMRAFDPFANEATYAPGSTAEKWEFSDAVKAAQQRDQSARIAANPQAAPEPVNTDPFGRFEDPTARNSVIRPTDTLESRSAAPSGASMLQQPSPPAPLDPFAAFNPGITPQGTPGQNPALTGPLAPPQPPTFGAPNEGVQAFNGPMVNVGDRPDQIPDELPLDPPGTPGTPGERPGPPNPHAPSPLIPPSGGPINVPRFGGTAPQSGSTGFGSGFRPITAARSMLGRGAPRAALNRFRPIRPRQGGTTPGQPLPAPVPNGPGSAY